MTFSDLLSSTIRAPSSKVLNVLYFPYFFLRRLLLMMAYTTRPIKCKPLNLFMAEKCVCACVRVCEVPSELGWAPNSMQISLIARWMRARFISAYVVIETEIECNSITSISHWRSFRAPKLLTNKSTTHIRSIHSKPYIGIEFPWQITEPWHDKKYFRNYCRAEKKRAPRTTELWRKNCE